MKELIVNLHIHSTYSDGTGTHADIGNNALQAGLDVVIVTDHNVLVKGVEKYFHKGARQVLLLVGEEVHDQDRQPQKSHLLVFNSPDEMSGYAHDSQVLIDQVNQRGGLAFIAHPYEKALPLFKEDDISWDNWEVKNYAGIELWNGMSEFKNEIRNTLHAIFLAYNPQWIPFGPNQDTLSRWDKLLVSGEKISAIGGSDSHAMHMSMGPFHKVVFPYLYHFRAINNHILTPSELSGDLAQDKAMIYDAFRNGRLFIGNDLIYPTFGFGYSAESDGEMAQMGETLVFKHGCTLRIRLPDKSECTLLKDGVPVNHWESQQVITHLTNQAGVYRVECHRRYLGARRGWIYSNPIYLHKKGLA
jgi:hypothetical protein